MNKIVKIAFVDCPYLVRSGIIQALRNSTQLRCNIQELNDTQHLKETLLMHHPDLIVMNPHHTVGVKFADVKSFCTTFPATRISAIRYAYLDQQTAEMFHAIFNIDDTPELIATKVEKMFHKVENAEDNASDNQELTQREKEIIVGVVKGLTNKEIADTLFISAHTVISHRRNIAKKLQIHSPSGLTIYAILNKLVDINEIKA